MISLQDSCAIAVIAKAPRPGHVKTRLQSVLRPEEAALLGMAFLRDTLDNLGRAAGDVSIARFVAYAPAGQEARFHGVVPEGAELVLADGSQGDAPGVQGFGRVLLDATRVLLARGYGAVCVLGADSPTLPTSLLVRSARVLLHDEADAVLGPADDGGYWLLGLTQPHGAAFADIAWSTEAVAAETRARVIGAGLRLAEMPAWYDVDDPPALARLVRECAHAWNGSGLSPYPAPHTAACIAAIGLAARLAHLAA